MELDGQAIGHVIARLLDEPDATADRDRTIPTLLSELDDLLAGGLRTGQSTIVASRPGEGSSTCALGLARAAALHQGLPTLLITPDAPETEVVMRLISAETHIPSSACAVAPWTTASYGGCESVAGDSSLRRWPSSPAVLQPALSWTPSAR